MSAPPCIVVPATTVPMSVASCCARSSIHIEWAVMRTSADRILTTHVGSLPRPPDLIEANRLREAGETGDEAGFQAKLRAAVDDIVQRQRLLGVDVPGDGEFGKSMGHSVNF